jgi:hypothetical protein
LFYLELSTLLEKIAFSPIDEVVFSGNKARVLLKKFPPANLLSYPSQEVQHISFGPTFSVKIDSEREGTFSTFRKYFSGKASFLTSVCFTRPWYPPCSLGLSATSQQYFSLRTNQPPATSQNQPAVLFSQNKPAPAISHQPTEQADHFRRFENTFRKRLLFSPQYVLPARGTH